ncbi:TusE/DsrC/DsvC family sulfur relay protein [Glaciecola petra]|uniref:Sulfurtransferase n=1 Tax=Glaciecola petra TaxID=3075602 RepID=A0ABU2ZNR6_9ALTE|nr:TusE/DsrC/DsvC family sulfur relay protein [Aestuariibacter sp. P117]MDT0594271.1 TusE/DsrC/DsvC family sulfur relay protein [Aestuariibacter sp. P117]
MSTGNTIEVNNRLIQVDNNGYLLDHKDWAEDVALLIAQREHIEMTDERWQVVNFVREFYLKYDTSPAIRALVKAMEQSYGIDKGNSRYLYRLFPKGPAKIATKIAGLPKPAKCL